MLNVWEYDRDDEFDLDLEDIMVMEAIWISLQVSSHLLSDECSMYSGRYHSCSILFLYLAIILREVPLIPT